MKSILAVVGLSLLLAGCATQKATIPYQYYEQIAFKEVGANKCLSQGYMDLQTAAAAKNFAAVDLNSWTYDPVVYQSVYSGVVSKTANQQVPKEVCESFAIATVQRQQQQQQAYQQQQIALQQQQAYTQTMQAIQNAAPKTTYCNKIGYQTVCNTY
ncbi:hypothetical protein ACK08B_22705 [Pantoea dispersa]|uniref:hypothetical protein n=1 Tax=Pantoea dispersa TaxID=59814 RepID=UPI00398A3DB0